jgi:hypothetical protein
MSTRRTEPLQVREGILICTITMIGAGVVIAGGGTTIIAGDLPDEARQELGFWGVDVGFG